MSQTIFKTSVSKEFTGKTFHSRLSWSVIYFSFSLHIWVWFMTTSPDFLFNICFELKYLFRGLFSVLWTTTIMKLIISCFASFHTLFCWQKHSSICYLTEKETCLELYFLIFLFSFYTLEEIQEFSIFNPTFERCSLW